LRFSSLNGGDKRSRFDLAAEEGIIRVLKVEGAVFRNEFHYKLEYPSAYNLDVSELHHERIDAAIKRLEEKQIICQTGPRGRPPSSQIKENIFYKLKDDPYNKPLEELMRKKSLYSQSIFDLASGQGFYAQKLWVEAIHSLGYNILDEETNKYNGIEATTSGDIDIIAELDNDVFGVEIKNGLSYPGNIKNKFKIAIELGLFPVIIARNFSGNDRIWVNKNGGIFKIYQTAIFNPQYKEIIEEAVNFLNLPIIFIEEIDDKVKNHLQQIIHNAIIIKEDFEERQTRFKATI